MLKSFQLVFLLTVIIIGESVAETLSKSHHKSSKPDKINKKLGGGKTAANGTYKYAVRMNLHLQNHPENKKISMFGQCSGAFLSFSASNPTKRVVRPTKYFFVTAAHCFNGSVQIKDVHHGFSKKSPFFTVKAGLAELEFEQLRNNLTNSSANHFTKHITVDTAVNIVRIPKEFHLNVGDYFTHEVLRADVAFMEFSKRQYDQIVAKGGEFIKGETNAYTKDRKQLDDCWIVSMGSIAVFRGTQLAAIDQNKSCHSGLEYWLITSLITRPDKHVTYAEPGDSGGPIVCRKGPNEHLMGIVSASANNIDTLLYSPQRENLRDWLEKAYYDDNVYNYFPPDNTSAVFIPTEQAGYIRA